MTRLPAAAVLLLAAACTVAPPAGLVDAGTAATADAGAADPFATAEDAEFAEALTAHRREVYTGDWKDMKRHGVLRVITRNNSTGYFLYKGRATGFFHDVAQMLGRELGVRVEMVVPPTRRDMVPYLLEGRGDIIVAGFSTSSERADRVAFTTPVLSTPWSVVMRADRAQAVKQVADLAGVPLLVHASGGALKRVRALMASESVALRPEAALESLEAEDLVDMVDEGTAEACVVPRRIAEVEVALAEGLAIALDLPGEAEPAAFAVRPESTDLLARVNAFLARHHRGTEWNVLYRRFHSTGERARAMREDTARADRKGALTPWDAQLQEAAREVGLDWRLLAAQAWQESRFDPAARSEAGAVGLMQLMPVTARSLGVKDPADPLQSLQAGARYMGKLLRRFPPDIALKDRVRFALAAYNAGPSHLDDARALARRLGLSSTRWFGNVEKAMRLLSRPRYYRKARFGFCRGEEPVRYVSEIQARYDHYVSLTASRTQPSAP